MENRGKNTVNRTEYAYTFDDIINQAIEYIDEGIKANQNYLIACADLERRDNEKKAKGVTSGGRLFQNLGMLTNDKKQIEIGVGIARKEIEPKMTNEEKLWPTGNKKPNKTFRLADSELMQEAFDFVYHDKQFDIDTIRKNLIDKINNNPVWQQYWKDLLDNAKHEKELTTIKQAYSAHLVSLVYAIACHSCELLEEYNDSMNLSNKFTMNLRNYLNLLKEGQHIEEPDWLKNYALPKDPFIYDYKNQDKNYGPDINQYKEKLKKVFGNNFGEIKAFIDQIPLESSRSEQRKAVFLKNLEAELAPKLTISPYAKIFMEQFMKDPNGLKPSENSLNFFDYLTKADVNKLGRPFDTQAPSRFI